MWSPPVNKITGQEMCCLHLRFFFVNLHILPFQVIGAGAFGTAMATLAGKNGYPVTLYARDANQALQINETKRNPSKISPLITNLLLLIYNILSFKLEYLSEFTLPDTIVAVSSIEEALVGSFYVYL